MRFTSLKIIVARHKRRYVKNKLFFNVFSPVFGKKGVQGVEGLFF